jgi:hypothetical protein
MTYHVTISHRPHSLSITMRLGVGVGNLANLPSVEVKRPVHWHLQLGTPLCQKFLRYSNSSLNGRDLGTHTQTGLAVQGGSWAADQRSRCNDAHER